MEYDFSGIPTESLRKAVKKATNGKFCASIRCEEHKCPFYEYLGCATNKEFGAMFREELQKRETMEEYKYITLDTSVREIMELYFPQLECFSDESSSWNSVSSKEGFDILEGLTEGIKYRYKLKPLEPARITKEMANDLRARVQNGGFKSLEEKYGRKVEIIGEDLG